MQSDLWDNKAIKNTINILNEPYDPDKFDPISDPVLGLKSLYEQNRFKKDKEIYD